MIENADRYLDAFVDAGATWISLHVEALPHLQRAVAHLKARGVQAGVALNPATPLAALEEILPDLDYVLVMSVNPGFGGQKFLPGSLDKVRRLRAEIADRGLGHAHRGGRRRRRDERARAGRTRGRRSSWPGTRCSDAAIRGAAARRLLEAARLELRPRSSIRVRYAETDQMGIA